MKQSSQTPASAGGGVVLRVGVETVANVARADLDQTGTALCALLVKVYQVVANMVVVGLLDGHWQHDESDCAISTLPILNGLFSNSYFTCAAPFLRT